MRWYIEIAGKLGVVGFDRAATAVQAAEFLNAGGYGASVVAVSR